MILETLVTTRATGGTVNLAPMGPTIPAGASRDPRDWTELVLRPFATSRTCRNLRERPEGVIHVTDDVLLLAKATLGNPAVEFVPSRKVECPRLADCCRWHEFVIDHWQEDEQRPTLRARILHTGIGRPFVGFHRARHAVLEAAILASRTHLLPRHELLAELEGLRPQIEKTASADERAAFALLEAHIRGERREALA